MTQHRLSWDKVNAAHALFQSGLTNAGVKPEKVLEITNAIARAGSFANYERQVQSNVKQLDEREKTLTINIGKLTSVRNNLQYTISKMREEAALLGEQVAAEQVRLTDIEDAISNYTDEIDTVRALMKLITSPHNLVSNDFDKLVSLMVNLRKQRLIITSRLNNLGDMGAVERFMVEEYVLPKLSSLLEKHMLDLEEFRGRLAGYC